MCGDLHGYNADSFDTNRNLLELIFVRLYFKEYEAAEVHASFFVSNNVFRSGVSVAYFLADFSLVCCLGVACF